MVAGSLADKVTVVPDGPNVPPIGEAVTVGGVVSGIVMKYVSVPKGPELPAASLPKYFNTVSVDSSMGEV